MNEKGSIVKEDYGEEITRRFFEIHGFRIEKIPKVEGDRRADFNIKDDKNTYIVEVKRKSQDEKYVRELRERGEAYKTNVLGRTNAISTLIRTAAEQIRKTPKNEEEKGAFHLIVLVASDRDEDTQLSQFESTIYGLVDLLDETATAKPCFYFTFSEFYGLKDIDAILVLSANKCALCLNNLGARSEEMRETKLYAINYNYGALRDPEKMESNGNAYIADCTIDRHNEDEVLAYIKKKYGIEKMMTLRLEKHTGTMRVDYE